MQSLRILRPDDWHLHVRDGAQLASVLPFTARQFARAIIMPNLKPPVTTVAMAAAYRERILAALPAGARFEPLMTLYLTDTTSPQEIRAAQGSGFIVGAKLYPAGATTHSDAGVTAIEKIYPALEAMQDVRARVPGARRSDRRRRRRLRSRARLHRSHSRQGRRALPGSAHRVRARHDARSGAVRQERAARRRRDDHAAAFAAESQRDLPGRHSPAQLLPAGAEARARSTRADRSRDRRRHAFLPRHRQRAAREAHQGNNLRLCRNLLRARRHRAVRGSIRAGRQARSLASLRLASAARTSTACRAIASTSRWSAPRGRRRPPILSTRTSWCHFAPASSWPGA